MLSVRCGLVVEVAHGCVAVAHVRNARRRDRAFGDAVAARDDQVEAAQIELLDQVRDAIRFKHYAYCTEET